MKKIKLFISLLTVLTCTLNTVAQTPIFHLDFNENSGSTTAFEQLSQTELNIQNAFDRPERIPANFGSALRLDGYSTYLNNSNYFITNYTNEYTVEAWYATDAFTHEPAAILQSQTDQGGFKLEVNPLGNLIFSFFFNGQERSLKPNKVLSKYEWHHIVATVNAASGEANIYVDGERWLQNKFPENATLDKSEAALWVGQSALNLRFSGFSLNTLNGAIDELKVYDQALTELEIQANFELATQIEADLFIDPLVRHVGDYLRPQYHPMPNTAWTNEPYGLTYYDGEYHLFFQKNPNGPYLYFMHWGHLSSPDLVSWTEEPIPLAPSSGFDDFGVWSGTTTFDQNGEPVIFYTGVDGSKAGIGSAFPQDSNLIEWQENRNNPLIPNPPPNFFSLDFRDPYIFRKDDLYYMIVGSGLSNNGGGILFTYTSPDLENWTLTFPAFQSGDFENHGTFWEMPAMIEFEENEFALVVTPQFSGAPADVIYWTGPFDGESFRPNNTEPKRLELISENFLAPAFGRDEADRWTYIGIIPDDRDVGLQIDAGWRHTFSLPRVARLLDDKQTIASVPHPNLCRLRLDTVFVENRTINANTNFNLPEFSTNQGELEFDISFETAELIQVQLFKSTDGSERTSIILDRENGRVGLDRRFSSPYPTVEDIRYENYLFRQTGDVNLRVFIDHSVIEIFIDNLVVFSARVYPAESSTQVDIVTSSGSFLIHEFNGYRLGSKAESFPGLACEEGELPGGLFTNTIDLIDPSQINVFPNPTNGLIYLSLEESITAPFMLRVYDIDGRLIKQQYQENLNREFIEIQLNEDCSSGIYLISIITKEGKVGVKRFTKI